VLAARLVIQFIVALGQPPSEPDDEVDASAPIEPPAAADVSPFMPPRELEQMRTRQFGKASWIPAEGLRVQTDDERFSLTFRLRVQLRYELQHDDETGDIGHLFSVRRARLQFKGNVFGKHNKYYLQIATSPSDVGWTDGRATFTPIRNWEISFDYLRDLTVTIGQMKVPFNRQRVISSGDIALPDRTEVNNEFNLDRDIGVMLSSNDIGGLGYLRYRLGVFNGEGRDAYQFDRGLLYVARVEVVPSGDAARDWDGDEVDWDRQMRPSVSLSGSYAFHDRASRERGSLGGGPLDGGTTNFHHGEADVMVQVAGLTVSSEFHYRKGIRSFGDATVTDDMGALVPAPQTPARSGLGYFVQAGFLVPRIPVGLVARWGQRFGQGDGTQTSLANRDELGAGLNWYIARHSLKLQAAYNRTRADQFDLASASFIRRSWADGLDLFQVQLQLAF